VVIGRRHKPINQEQEANVVAIMEEDEVKPKTGVELLVATGRPRGYSHAAGIGSDGIVFLARCISDNQQVAVKMVPKDTASEEEYAILKHIVKTAPSFPAALRARLPSHYKKFAIQLHDGLLLRAIVMPAYAETVMQFLWRQRRFPL
jgi:hypothetical protein